VFEQGQAVEIVLEIIWLMSSLVLMFAYLALIFHILVKRISRVFFILLTLALQQLVNELILKRALAEARPLGACSHSYGLPSGHSSFAASFATWLILEWILFHEKVPFKTSKSYIALTTIAILATPLIPISRYYLNYHTIKQICFGVLSGFVCATVSFCILMAIVYRNNHRFENSMMTRLLRKLKFKDVYVSYETINEEQKSEQEDIEGQIKAKIQAKIIFPLRVKIHNFIWRYCPQLEQAKTQVEQGSSQSDQTSSQVDPVSPKVDKASQQDNLVKA